MVAHNVMTMHFNLPFAASLAGRRVLAWTHDLAWTNPRYRAFHRDGPPYDLLHEPAPGVRYTAISERVRTQLAETYGVTAEAVPNGIDRARLLRIRPSTLALLEPAGVLEEPAGAGALPGHAPQTIGARAAGGRRCGRTAAGPPIGAT